MATIVCQGLQSCLESHLVDLRLNFSSSKPHFSQPLELALKSCFLESNNTKEVVAGDKCHVEENTNSYKPFNQSVNQTSSNPDLGGWSFLQTLPNSSQGLKETMEKDKTTYVHPLVKRSKSMLSDKSLELCTENLGNETGTDIVENSIFSLLLPSSDSKGGNLPTREQQKSRQLLGAKKANQNHHHRHHNHNFPPPLTTISGSESLQVRPHREDGRLIIEAVKVPAKQNYFQAERSHGRLRLCFLKSSTPSVDSEEENEASTEDNGNFGFDNDVNGEKREVKEDFEDNTEKDVHTLSIDEDDDQIQMDEAISLSSGEAEIEMEMETEKEMEMEMEMEKEKEKEKEKFERPRRCKECEHEKKGLLNWEPMWVATS